VALIFRFSKKRKNVTWRMNAMGTINMPNIHNNIDIPMMTFTSTPSEQRTVKICGSILLGFGLVCIFTYMPVLVRNYHDGRFQAMETHHNLKSEPSQVEHHPFIPGLAGFVLGIAFSALGIAAIFAARRTAIQPVSPTFPPVSHFSNK
jgi:hypothetical protein